VEFKRLLTDTCGDIPVTLGGSTRTRAIYRQVIIWAYEAVEAPKAILVRFHLATGLPIVPRDGSFTGIITPSGGPCRHTPIDFSHPI